MKWTIFDLSLTGLVLGKQEKPRLRDLMKGYGFIMLVALAVTALVLPVHAESEEKSKSVDNGPATASAGSESRPSAVIPSSGELRVVSAIMSESADSSSSPEPASSSGVVSPAPNAMIRSPETRAPGVQWKSLINASLLYLGGMHTFRLATEPSTREGLHNSVIGGYFKSLGAMHGWSDGDGYYENYLGHPIEGAVSGYIWIHNDPRYRAVQFGASRDYWMSRLRAYAFAWAFSEQFEIGPISEASIGQIQRRCCAYGFVDHVITPNGGLVWMLVGDALDRYVTVPIENRIHNNTIRTLVRVGLNPPQTFANLMMLRYPWQRENRPTASKYDGEMNLRPSQSLATAVNPEANPAGFNVVPKFELAASLPGIHQLGGLNCLGGGGIGAFRATDSWQWTVEVSGCTLGNSLPRNWSGDSLTFTAGPQWILHTRGRWSPHAHFRIGGQKVTEGQVNPELRKLVLSQLPPGTQTGKYQYLYTRHWETTGFSLSAGGGLDLALNRALAVRVANLEYTRSWLADLNGRNFDRGLRFSTGIVLRVGTW